MCGLAGLLDPGLRGHPERLGELGAALAVPLEHRGPDDHGVWSDPDGGVTLGHRRLSILDLSPAGRQPMTSASGQWAVVHNGEVYNHASLRGPLRDRGVRFRSGSDAEVLVEALAAWGLEPTLDRIRGMFAFAAWDRERRNLHLVRDRMGVKPLYEARTEGAVLFASELEAMRAHPGFRGELDRRVLPAYFRRGWIPTPNTVYADARKIRPGTAVTYRVVDGRIERRERRYFSLRETAKRNRKRPVEDPRKAVDALETTLRQAVEEQLVSDVPLGAFLSGGTDSSVVVALMQEVADRPVRTFTMGFRRGAYDERPHARRVANRLGTEHREEEVSEEQARAVIPRLPEIFDEPFADPSQIPTHLLSRLTRKHVKVALSGDGGDELFGGYDRYRRLEWLDRLRRWTPAALRRFVSKAAKSAEDTRVGLGGTLSVEGGGLGRAYDRGLKAARMLDAGSPEALYRALTGHWTAGDGLLADGAGRNGTPGAPASWPTLPTLSERASCLDAETYLPDDILTKVDRASMAVGLEVRVPILDHRIVELAWRFPASLKRRGGTSKWILRRVLERHVPRDIFDRPKKGFGVPLAEWLRGPLRDWADRLLDEERLRAKRLLRPEVVRRKWREHRSGARNWHYHLWNVLMLEAWLDEHDPA